MNDYSYKLLIDNYLNGLITFIVSRDVMTLKKKYQEYEGKINRFSYLGNTCFMNSVYNTLLYIEFKAF